MLKLPGYQVITKNHWDDYELIDSGDFSKLERFGKYTLSRPEPQAVWKKKLSDAEWNQRSHAVYTREKGRADKLLNAERGQWKTKAGMPDFWFVSYRLSGVEIRFRLALTAFGHIGVFPEQADNWNYIHHQLQHKTEAKVLNLFAYTGGASLVAKAAGADVTHVDSIRSTVSWASQNQEASRLNNIRWVIEDAMKYVKREAKRGNSYDGIVMDPPAYGRGPAGEKWVLEEGIDELFQLSSVLLKSKGFLIVNLYSMGLSALVLNNLAACYFAGATAELGEIVNPSATGQGLPLGTFLRLVSA